MMKLVMLLFLLFVAFIMCFDSRTWFLIFKNEGKSYVLLISSSQSRIDIIDKEDLVFICAGGCWWHWQMRKCVNAFI